MDSEAERMIQNEPIKRAIATQVVDIDIPHCLETEGNHRRKVNH